MALAGKAAHLKIGANTVAELNDISFNLEGDNLDTTVMTATGTDFRSRIQGLKAATVNGSGFRDPSDTNGQQAIYTAWLNDTLLSDVTMMFDTTNGIKCDARVASFDAGATVAGEVTVSFTLESDGAIAAV